MNASPAKLDVQGTIVRVIGRNRADYVCITDIVTLKNPLVPKDVIKNWMRSRSTLAFLGLWEKLPNPGLKGVDFAPLLAKASDNAFTMSPTRRVRKLNEIAIQQMRILAQSADRKLLRDPATPLPPP